VSRGRQGPQHRPRRDAARHAALQVIYDIGEGGTNGRDIKPCRRRPLGGCIPAEMFDTPVDYETLAQLGSIMGSGAWS